MKNLKSTLLTLAALLCSTAASAYDFKVDGIFYNITDSYNLTVRVTYESDINDIYNSYSGDVVIPTTVTYDNKVYKVTGIDNRAFYKSNALTSVVIPESVTSIDECAFQGCSSLASIAIPEGVTRIGYGSFRYCSNLTSITIPNSVTYIENYAFNGCSNLSAVYISDMEAWCKISFGDFECRLLYYAKNLYLNGELVTELTIPSTLTAIKAKTFYGCTSITSINIPESVTSFGSDAFGECSNLTDVYYAGDFESWMQLYFADGSSRPNRYAKNVYFNGETLTEVEIPSSMTSISDYAFKGFSGLTSITIPSNVTSIGWSAFEGCSSLTSITIPNNVTSIGGSAFEGCSSLTSITIPNNVTSIGWSAFEGCSSLISITIPNSVTSIDWGVFNGCSALKELIFEDGSSTLSLGSGDNYNGLFHDCPLETLYLGRDLSWSNSNNKEHSPFYNKKTLTKVTIGDNVTSIGSYAFSGCSALKELIFEDGSSTLSLGGGDNNGLFYDCPLETLYLGRDLSYSSSGYNGYSPFYNNKSLTNVTIGNGVTTIGRFAFRDCSSLASVNMGNSVATIGEYAFMGCSNLLSITLPESVASIDYKAFSDTRELILKSTTPPTLTSSSLLPGYAVITVPKEAYSDYSTATYWVDLLANITIDDADARVKNLTLTADENKSALQVAIGEEEVKYVTDLTISGTINSYDFMILRNKMPLLRHLNLENATIVANAYEHYTGYCTQDNMFPGYGLYNCKLLSLTFPKNITSVETNGVANNTYLSDVTLFDGVSSIGSYAFINCYALTAITLPEGVTSIGEYAFYSCGALTNITFLDGLTSIGCSAFSSCCSLGKVVLPPTVKTIEYSAFSACSNLTEIRIPSSIRLVGDNAFQYCDNLNDVYVYTVEPISIGQDTFAKNGNNFRGTLHAPKVSYWDYYYNTQWGQFASFAEFDEPYDNFYLQGDKVLDSETGAIEGEGDDAPDAEMGSNSGIIVEDNVEQDLGNVDIEHNGSDGGSIIVGGEGCVNADELHFHINVQGGRWYFFCFPFDVRREDIVLQNGAEWVFRYYDGEERAKNGKGGWKNVTSDGNGNHLKAATGYIFQCSKDDVLILTAKNQKIKQEKKYNELVEHITQNAHDASWNFVGNPYLSYYEVTSDDYSAPITVWDGSKYIAIRPGDDDYQLAPFEAFFVQKPEGVANVDYSPERQHTYHGAQEAAAQARARRRAMPVNPDRLLVNITLGNGTDSDQTRVVFNNEAAMGYETACDAAKFETAGMPQIYTVDSRAVKYAINERPVAEGIVTLGYTAPTEGVYTLAAPRMDTPIYIKDNLTGTIHDFAEGSYEFASEAGTFDDRFTVIMKAGETGIDNAEIGNQNSEIYNVKGQRVNEATEQGIYIKENRKVVIK